MSGVWTSRKLFIQSFTPVLKSNFSIGVGSKFYEIIKYMYEVNRVSNYKII
jgi:hypothetical protein